MLSTLQANPDAAVPDVYNQTFHKVDTSLSKISEDSQGRIHSGCTAVTAFLRIEDAEGRQSFLKALQDSPSNITTIKEPDDTTSGNGEPSDHQSQASSQSRLKAALERFSQSSCSLPSTLRSLSPSTGTPEAASQISVSTVPQCPPAGSPLRRVLYIANAGDARGVLFRKGRALRLTYDHKGTDKQEAKRITDSGGFVMSGRVNGVLAVTRSLGDSSMKEFVVGAPYTTETELTEDDELLILACDGVSRSPAQKGISLLIDCMTERRYGTFWMTKQLVNSYGLFRILSEQRRLWFRKPRIGTRMIISQPW